MTLPATDTRDGGVFPSRQLLGVILAGYARSIHVEIAPLRGFRMGVTHARDHAQATHCHDKLFTHNRLINTWRARPRSMAMATFGLKPQI